MEEKLPGGIPLTMVEKVVDYTCALGLVSLWTVPPAFRGTGESRVNRAGLA